MTEISNKRVSNLMEFIEHAPKIICDFEQAISKNDEEKIELLSKISRTLFQQINKDELAKDFNRYTTAKGFNLNAAQSLIRLSKKQIHLAQNELNALKSKKGKEAPKDLEIDLKLIEKMIGPNETAINEIVDMYGQQCIEYLSVIKHSFEKQDFLKVRKIAHTMKSSFSMIGCELLKNLAIKIEHSCEEEIINEYKLTEQLKEYDELVKNSIHLLKKEVKSKNFL